MAANNEIGTIAPLAEIGAIAAEHGLLFHVDGAQAVGHIPLDVQVMNIHILSISAHKLYGPKGVGALYRRRSNPRVLLEPVIYGGGHERGVRSGTLNVPAIVGFGEAIRLARRNMEKEAVQQQGWIDYMYNRFAAELGDVALNGHPTERLPNNLNVSVTGVKARALIPQLKDVALATGSACTSAKVEPSHVIEALGFGPNRAHSALRISVGRFNTDEQIKTAVDKIITAAQKLRTI
jgi:cysteine desulfurase